MINRKKGFPWYVCTRSLEDFSHGFVLLQRNNNYHYSHFNNSPQLQQILLYLTYYFFKIIHMWITFRNMNIKPYIAKTKFSEVLRTPLNGNWLVYLPFVTTLTLLYLGNLNGPWYQRSCCLVGEAISQDAGNSASNIASKLVEQ